MKKAISLPMVAFVLLVLLVNRLLAWGGALTVLGSGGGRILPVILVGIALGTDALSLSIGIGLRGVAWSDVIRVSTVVGLFHVIMPLAGTLGGHIFGVFAGDLARWVGAGVVAFIGARMVWGCLVYRECVAVGWTLTGLPLLALAASVSMDALSVGFSMGTFGYGLVLTALVFGIFGTIMTGIGLLFGSHLGCLVGDRAELFGGGVLLALAVHMFLEG